MRTRSGAPAAPANGSADCEERSQPPFAMAGLAIKLAEAPSGAQESAAAKLFFGRREFVKGVVSMGDLPPPDKAEVCFAGRSNVGKSSLINSLVKQRGFARTSKTPGRTRELNYFSLGETHYLVDLPGYGYARMPKTAAERCQRLLRSYLRGRPSLRRVFLLLDSRHLPKRSDEEFMRLLDQSAVSFQIVLTKSDKVGGAKNLDVDRLLGRTLNSHPAGLPEVIATSSHSGEGVDCLRAAVTSIA